MADLTTNIEDAFILWLQAVSTHGQDMSIVPRRYSETKFDDDGDLNPITLPALVVKATRQQQLHTNVAVYFYVVDIGLYLQADDTLRSDWDAQCERLETMMLAEELARYLNALMPTINVRGITQRLSGDKIEVGRAWRFPVRCSLWASRAV
jgi:hypothetical protein